MTLVTTEFDRLLNCKNDAETIPKSRNFTIPLSLDRRSIYYILSGAGVVYKHYHGEQFRGGILMIPVSLYGFSYMPPEDYEYLKDKCSIQGLALEESTLEYILNPDSCCRTNIDEATKNNPDRAVIPKYVILCSDEHEHRNCFKNHHIGGGPG